MADAPVAGGLAADLPGHFVRSASGDEADGGAAGRRDIGRWVAGRLALVALALAGLVLATALTAPAEGYSSGELQVRVVAVTAPLEPQAGPDDALAAAAAGGGVEVRSPATLLPRSIEPAWTIVELSTRGTTPFERVVYLRQPTLESVRYYLRNETGAWAEAQSASGLADGDLMSTGLLPAARVQVDPARPTLLLVRVHTPGARHLPLVFVSPNEYLRGNPLRFLMLGFGLGLPLTIALAVVAVGRAREWPGQLAFFGLNAALVASMGWYSGLAGELFPRASPWLMRAIGVGCLQLLAALTLLNAVHLLDTRLSAPTLARWLRRLGIALGALALPVGYFASGQPLAAAGAVVASATMLSSSLGAGGAALALATRSLARGDSHVGHVWWATVVYLSAVVLLVESVAGLMPKVLLHEWLFIVAPLLCVLLGIAVLRRFAGHARASAVRATRAEGARAAQEREYRVRQQLFAASSHDMSHPLQALSMDVQSLRDANPGLADERFDRIRASIQEIQSHLDALIVAIRSDSPDPRLQVRDFPVGALLQQLVARYRPLAATKGLSLRWAASDAWVRSDPLLLSRILENLLVNAIRHTDQGSILMGCRRADGGRRLRICVIDTGPGIAPVQARHWQDPPGTQIPAARTPLLPAAVDDPASWPAAFEGHGLGLFIVKRLADLLGHTLGVRSAPGRGSMLWVGVERVATALPPAAGIR